MNRFIFLLFSLLLLAACAEDKHFITDSEYRDAVHRDFEARKNLYPSSLRLDTLDNERREAMEFLYAYMPYSDLADYEPEFFLGQVDVALQTRETFGWNVPEDIFRHFVLVYRVNNENLDTARSYFYNEIKDRIKGMTLQQAALEVNHWCHEHLSYRASDGRTSSPLASLRTSLGRCGEESTFAVTALRAVGIPARQCYTPRWAHCDDNHAWVEVWTGDGWHYLGACEPDPELDMGWFTIPSTRAMMVHTKVFGRYRGDEEVVCVNALYSELNLLSHYTKTRRIKATVQDDDGKPLDGVTISFRLYNYAEYYPLAEIKSDANGSAELTTGYGDLLVWATDGDSYGFAKIDVRRQDNVLLHLDHAADSVYAAEFVMAPPAPDSTRLKNVDGTANQLRLAYEDSIRHAYMATFPTRDNFKEYVHDNENLTDSQLWEIIHLAEGNYAEMARFLNNHRKAETGLFLYDYLCSFSEKDLRDTPAEIFEHHLTRYDGKLPLDVYKKGIMPARISNELVRPWRNIALYIEPSVDDTGNYYHCPISPAGVERLMVADPHSRDIYFIASCRANGIPAYLDWATDIVYVYRDGEWHQRKFGDAHEEPETATIHLLHDGSDYYVNYTLQRMIGGEFVTLDYEGDGRLALSPSCLTLAPGTYCCSKGTRDQNGTVFSSVEVFNVSDGATHSLDCRPLGNPMRAELRGLFTLDLELGPHGEPAKHTVLEMIAAADVLNHLCSRITIQTSDPRNEELQRLASAVPVVQVFPTYDYASSVDYPIATLKRQGKPVSSFHGYRIGGVSMLFSNLSSEPSLPAARR
ncbi:MAG: transglutaminase domain-containing protein [Paludibacteraceae bacterium]|nr:transglutaminase domain-containing protein [Paludibacteraceae bacterium]